jgi:hypothetical protein
MITNEEIASKISERLLEVSSILDEAVSIVQENCAEPEAAAFRRAVGKVLGELLLGVMNPIYEQHSRLRPKGLDAPTR